MAFADNSLAVTSQTQVFELRFQSLFNEGRALSFPCDAGGHVDMDAMTEHAKVCYLGARALIGHDYSYPFVQPAHH